MDRQILGERIRAARELRGLSQQSVAHSFGCARETVSNWERGERGIEAPELARLARVFDVDVTYFYGTGEYQADDVPPELQMVYGLQGRVMSHLPPGRARQRYIESLRAQAESNWALIEGRLEDEEGIEEKGTEEKKTKHRRQNTEGEQAEKEKAKDRRQKTEAAGTGVEKVDGVKRGRGTRAVRRAESGPEVQEQ